MSIGAFFGRCLLVTFCVGLLLFFFYPRYEYIEGKKRFDRIYGEIQYHDGWWR